MIDRDTALGHHLFKITQTERVGDVPPHAQQHHIERIVESAPGRCPEQASFAVFALSSSGSQSIFVSLECYLCRLSATEPLY
jgi:hypothetical protein